MFPGNKEELREDLWFFLKISLVCTLGFSMANDVPEMDVKSIHPSVENGECKRFDGRFVCFGTWKVLGVDTGLSVGLYSYQDFDYVDVFEKIFWRESDLVEKKSWPDGSSVGGGGNWSGSLPDFNVSVIEGIE